MDVHNLLERRCGYTYCSAAATPFFTQQRTPGIFPLSTHVDLQHPLCVAFHSRDVTLYLDNPLLMGYLDHFQYFAIINTTVMNGLVYTS